MLSGFSKTFKNIANIQIIIIFIERNEKFTTDQFSCELRLGKVKDQTETGEAETDQEEVGRRTKE